jgi:hypothetical protein
MVFAITIATAAVMRNARAARNRELFRCRPAK